MVKSAIRKVRTAQFISLELKKGTKGLKKRSLSDTRSVITSKVQKLSEKLNTEVNLYLLKYNVRYS